MASSLDETTLAETPAVLAIQDELERDEQEEWEYEYSTTETEARIHFNLLTSAWR